jgi:hypothetical protein
MPRLALRLPGDYWDSYLYMGYLYLFEQTGSLRVVDWERLVSTVDVPVVLQAARRVAFVRNDLLYPRRNVRTARVPSETFNRLANLDLEITQLALEAHTVIRQANPFPFPHSDVAIYGRQLLVGSHDGLHQVECPFPDGRVQTSSFGGAQRRWDGHVLAIAAKYDRLAIAAGSDGLRELPLGVFGDGIASLTDDPPARAEINCTQCNWVFMHMYAGGPEPTGGLAQFDREDATKRRALIFVKFQSSTELFGDSGFSWAQGDRICMLSKDRLLVVRYRDRHRRRDASPLEARRSQVESDDIGEPIAAAVGVFGLVVEYESLLQIVLSNQSAIELEPPARWRVFPRSNFYENQVHFIYDDHLDIAAFVQDAEVTQSTKVVGAQYRQPLSRSYKHRSSDEVTDEF